MTKQQENTKNNWKWNLGKSLTQTERVCQISKHQAKKKEREKNDQTGNIN